ncbi:MAG TPA: rRNA maturation RNase YbeY [Gammaproteobacteria bacterium]|nr:rRNA maturation RNase YbeY [Gammaproteobacteria bacterium]
MKVEVQRAVDGPALPAAQQIRQWAEAALQQARGKTQDTHMTVRIVDVDEISRLNEQYRRKTGPTNVLSFPFEAMPGIPAELAEAELGDVLVCAAVVQGEAQEQGKTSEAHWAHMIIHGTLHLLGYDHLNDEQATEMESLEIATLAGLGYADPYS